LTDSRHLGINLPILIVSMPLPASIRFAAYIISDENETAKKTPNEYSCTPFAQAPALHLTKPMAVTALLYIVRYWCGSGSLEKRLDDKAVTPLRVRRPARDDLGLHY